MNCPACLTASGCGLRPGPAWHGFAAPITSVTRRDHWPSACATLLTAQPDGTLTDRCACSPTCATCGHGFNPVSFYYCFDPTGKTVEHIVAEVNNTPWGEQHCYLLNATPAQQELRVQRFELDKQFHVSPFMGMDIHYQWSFARPGNRLFAHLQNSQDGDKLFDATLSLDREPITSASLSGVLLRFPLMTLKIKAAIYYQALRLWLKKIPFITHPAKKEAPYTVKT